MKIYLSLLVLVGINCGAVLAIQFGDDPANLEQTKIVGSARGFFPSNDEPDDRYSDISGIKYVDYESFSDNRKQLNFNGNLPVHSPPPTLLNEYQFYQQQQGPPPYRPPPQATTINSANAYKIRKRPSFPYQFAKPPNYYYNQYPMDLSNPHYQNYANYYQYTSPSVSSPSPSSPYYDYINPTRYPSQAASANLYGHTLHQPQSSLHHPNYYTNNNNYANQFAYQQQQRPVHGQSGFAGNGNGITSFINNVRETNGPLGQLTNVGSQFSKALEDISINDDLQCVPRLLCQMIRNPRRPNQFPSFLNIPGLTAIISALPSSSPLMNFGRAALLGLSGDACDSSYPRCPKNEDQLLYYLNNHRGGFFRFFNGGNSFGDDNFLQSQQQQQQLNQQQIGETSQGLNYLALQALADTLGGAGNGFNLNNLFSSPTNQRPGVQNYQGLQADQSQSAGLLSMFKPSTLTDVVSNLLTGVIGNRFSRRLSKRSLPHDFYDNDNDEGHRIQKRVVNLKNNHISFQESNDDIRYQQLQQQQPEHKNTLFDDIERPFKFSNENRITQLPQKQEEEQQQQQSYALKFPHDIRNVYINQGNLITPADIERRLKMLFPDVEHFSDQFNQNLMRLIVNDRLGKILTGGQRPISSNNNINANYYSVNRYPVTQSQYAGNSGSSNYNNYNYANTQQSQKQTSNNENRSHIVYVTNGQGQIEYTLNELTGEKTRYL